MYLNFAWTTFDRSFHHIPTNDLDLFNLFTFFPFYFFFILYFTCQSEAMKIYMQTHSIVLILFNASLTLQYFKYTKIFLSSRKRIYDEFALNMSTERFKLFTLMLHIDIKLCQFRLRRHVLPLPMFWLMSSPAASIVDNMTIHRKTPTYTCLVLVRAVYLNRCAVRKCGASNFA